MSESMRNAWCVCIASNALLKDGPREEGDLYRRVSNEASAQYKCRVPFGDFKSCVEAMVESGLAGRQDGVLYVKK